MSRFASRTHAPASSTHAPAALRPTPRHVPVHPLATQTALAEGAAERLTRLFLREPPFGRAAPSAVPAPVRERAAPGAAQASLTVGPADSPAEREADALGQRFADRLAGRDVGRGVVAQTPSAPALRRQSVVRAPPPVAPSRATPAGAGHALPEALLAQAEDFFGRGLGHVRVHHDGAADRSARRLDANAFTHGADIVFGAGRYAPHTPAGVRLLGHELTHVVQQHDVRPHVQRQPRPQGGPNPPALDDSLVNVEVIGPRRDFRNPRSGRVHRPGDAAATRVLTRIEEGLGGQITFHWFNFSLGMAATGPVDLWEYYQDVGSAFSPLAPTFADLGRQMSSDAWQRASSDPTAELLRRFEASQIHLSDEAVVEVNRGMVLAEAHRSLAENEAQIDELLDDQSRIARLQQYAEALKEASRVRDFIVQERDRIAGELNLAEQSLEIARAHATLTDEPLAAQRAWHHVLPLRRRYDLIDRSHLRWISWFGLLSRLRTSDITPERIQSTLCGIRTAIRDTRASLDRTDLSPEHLDNVQARVSGGLGPRTQGVLARDAARRHRWGMLATGASLVGGTALLFLPGGLFLSTAIGVAMTTQSWEHARIAGQAAQTGMDVDSGLMSQAAVADAETAAVFSAIFAIAPAAMVGLRVMATARMVMRLRTLAPTLGIAARVRIARSLVTVPELQAASHIDALLAEQQVFLSANDLQALRATVYELQAAPLEGGAASSLRAFLRRIFRQRQLRSGDDNNWTYRQYSTSLEENPLAMPPSEYDSQVSRLAQGRPRGSVSLIQPDRTGQPLFAHFYRADTNPHMARHRIYLHVRADSAPAMMQQIVRQVVDNPAQFPGVTAAKVTMSGHVTGRVDTIVFYAETESAAQAAMTRIRMLQQEFPRSFLSSTPPMTEPVFRGVGIAHEPPPVGERLTSFGTSRSSIIQNVLNSSAANETEEQFITRVFTALRESGVDPAAPHLSPR